MDGTEPSQDLKKGEASRPPPFLRSGQLEFGEISSENAFTVWLYFEALPNICVIITRIGVREGLMFTVFVLGNIASGKSTACRYFKSRGALLIDLDELAKSLYVPGSDIVNLLVEEFGWDILDEQGGIRRNVLASRAFVSSDAVARLNDIVHPVLIEQLSLRILDPVCCTVSSPRYPFAVVEVSAPTGFEDAFGLADEILVISAPLAIRRERAIHRGMEPSDFDARSACQPDETSLCSLATTVIDNEAGDNSLFEQLDAWLSRHGFSDVADKEDADV